MRILISAASGLIGSVVSTALTADGHRVIRLVRRPPGAGEVRWDPAAGVLDPTAMLAHALAETPRPPQTLIAASAIGYYGDRGDEVLTEESLPGIDWLARL